MKKILKNTKKGLLGFLFILVILILLAYFSLIIFMKDLRQKNLERNASYDQYKVVFAKEKEESKRNFLFEKDGYTYYAVGIKEVYFQFDGVTLTFEDTLNNKHLTMKKLLENSKLTTNLENGKILVYENRENRYNRSYYKIIKLTDFNGLNEYIFLTNETNN